MTSTTGRAATPNISRGVLRPRAPGSWQAEHQQIRGTATALGIAPGSTFTLYNAPHADDNREYLTLQANYHLKENRYASGDDQSSEHRIDFIVLPADVPRHPPQQATAENPRAADRPGGRPGRRINLDRQIRPHQGEIPLGPLRAEGRRQLLLGARLQRTGRRGYGGVQIPRVNDEVVVDFISGDPDRPIVTGRVYNEASMPPWALPAAATQMGFMSRSKMVHLIMPTLLGLRIKWAKSRFGFRQNAI